MYVVDRGVLLGGSTALADACGLLTPFGFVCNLFKTAQVQRLYDWVAARRYRIFGCRESCYIIKN